MRLASSFSGLRGWSAARSVVLLCALGAAALAACDNTDSCGDAECTSDVRVRLSVELPREEMQRAVIRACRNESCNTGSATNIPTFVGDTLRFPLQGVLPVHGQIDLLEGSTAYRVEVVFDVDERQIGTSDSYELAIESNGAEVTAIKQPARYTESTPNGRDCPPICRNAIIE